MISFASTTGAAVCGEGVEDLADLRALADLDATYAQGYALARPAPAWPELTEEAIAGRLRGRSRWASAWPAAAPPAPGRTSSPTSPTTSRASRTATGSRAPGTRVAALLAADEVALLRVNERDELVELLSAMPDLRAGLDLVAVGLPRHA